MNVELRIEELVLHGFPPGEHLRIGEVVERELTRLFVEEGVPPALSHDADTLRLDAGTFTMKPDLGADAVGAQVARSLYRGMRG